MVNEVKMRTHWMLIVALCLRAFVGSAQEPHPPRIQVVIGITGENGVVALKDGAISMYSRKSLAIISGGEKRARQAQSNDGVVSLVLNRSRWEQSQEHLGTSAAFTPGLCDRLNQINLASIHSQVSKALPNGAMIKAVYEEGGMAVAVYSTSASAVRYKIYIGLLKRGKNQAYSLINSELVSEAGNLCGVQESGDNQYIILVDEPAGSSDYLTAYVCSVMK
jgi:hypothetical protein